MSKGIVVNDLSEILKGDLDVADAVERSSLFAGVMEALDKEGYRNISVKVNEMETYMNRILAANQHVNLTAITDHEEFVAKHYEDSLSIVGLLEYRDADKILDLGTGGGFPGVPLAIADEAKNFVLVDSLAKRLNVIDEICHHIGISNIETVHGRAEDLGRSPDHREKYDLVVSRAVSNLRVLAEYCLPFVSTGGHMVAYKKSDCDEELREAANAIEVLGGTFKNKHLYDDNALIIIEKVGGTPDKYPRRAGMPSKKPL